MAHMVLEYLPPNKISIDIDIDIDVISTGVPASGVPTVGVTRFGTAMVSPLYQLCPPLSKCEKVNA